MKKLEKLIDWIVMIALLVAIGIYINSQFDFTSLEEEKVGSIITGQDYNATTTPFDTGWTSGQIKKGSGSLGSVIVTSAGDVHYMLLDATSTVATNRPTARQATSSVLIADIPASLAAGTYIFDVEFIDGLLLNVVSGSNGTTTVTFR